MNNHERKNIYAHGANWFIFYLESCLASIDIFHNSFLLLFRIHASIRVKTNKNVAFLMRPIDSSMVTITSFLFRFVCHPYQYSIKRIMWMSYELIRITPDDKYRTILADRIEFINLFMRACETSKSPWIINVELKSSSLAKGERHTFGHSFFLVQSHIACSLVCKWFPMIFNHL